MREKAEAALLASFAGDALSLGVHWKYDAEKLAQVHGRVETYIKPGPNSYHANKPEGGFTHYGDQSFVLLQSLAANNGFMLEDFFERWKMLFDGYDGYFDQATKATLKNIARGDGPENCGSLSNDIAGAGRMAPLILAYGDDLESLVRSARFQTRMTHTDPLTMDSAEFFARVAWEALNGRAPSKAMAEVTENYFEDSMISIWVEQGLKSRAEDSKRMILRFGQSCHTSDAFSGIVNLIAKYENNLKEAMVQSVMGGGDNAARSMVVGMVLGAYLGMDALPEAWVLGLAEIEKIRDLIQQI